MKIPYQRVILNEVKNDTIKGYQKFIMIHLL